MNSRERVLAALRGEEPDRVPYCELGIDRALAANLMGMGVLDSFRLDKKVALVTGVGRGLGQAIAIGLAEAGADIAGLYRTHYEDTQTQVETLGRRFLPIQCDLQEATVARLNEVVDQVVSEMARL